MNETDYLRREIEIRLIRETIYRAIDALNTKQSLNEHILKNDETISWIGEFLINKGSDWEEFYQNKCKK